MHYLDLNAVHAGMVVGRDLHDAQGRILMQAGSVLTAGQIRLLRERRIERVPIAPLQTPALGAEAADDNQALSARFRLCDERHPVIGELRRLCRDRRERVHGERDDD
ncbi:MAG: hypothetical protein ACLGH6_03150 [Gammaproteobacteria bacterium]